MLKIVQILLGHTIDTHLVRIGMGLDIFSEEGLKLVSDCANN